MTKVEELREELMKPVEQWISSIEGEWSVDLTHEKVDFERILDSLVSAVEQQTQNQYKETLANVTAECVKECARQSVAAHAEGVAEALEEDDYAIERVALVIAYEKGKVAAASDALLEKLLSAKTRGLVDTSQEYIDAIASTPAVKKPKLGDTVTWRDSDTGGMLSGVVTTVHMVGVQVATNRGGGNVGYNLVLNDDVIHIQPRELLEGGAT